MRTSKSDRNPVEELAEWMEREQDIAAGLFSKGYLGSAYISPVLKVNIVHRIVTESKVLLLAKISVIFWLQPSKDRK